MIKSIKLKNIQSHEDTKLDFSEGVNCIIGSSNNGKSAILRGLYWVVNNRPLGVDTLCSHWAMTEKGNLKDEMSVTVENTSGKIIRRRTKTENQYFVNDKELNVVKSDVPDEVAGTLLLSETNIQKQLDEPFLLSKSAGEVAKYFNKSVRLDVIDKVLSNAESQKRKAKQETERLEKDIAGLEEKKEGFSWLEKAGDLINRYDKLEKEVTSIDDEIHNVFISLEKYYSAKAINEKYSGVSVFADKIEKIEVLQQEVKDVLEEGSGLSLSLKKIDELSKYPDFTMEKELISKIENELEIMTSIDDECHNISDSLENKKHCEEVVYSSREKIEEYRKQLPRTCPLCGNLMRWE